MSPYENLPEIQWKETTKRLINDHPLSQDVLISTVLEAWDGILRTKIANELQIGIDIFPTPQILGNYLHELIPVLLEKKYPGQWTRDIEKMIRILYVLLTRTTLLKSRHRQMLIIFMEMQVMVKKTVQTLHPRQKMDTI